MTFLSSCCSAALSVEGRTTQFYRCEVCKQPCDRKEVSATSSKFDVIGPYAGPCAFCGCDDKRHRVYDAIVDLLRAGEDVSAIAEDYGLSVAAVKAIEAAENTEDEIDEDEKGCE